MASRIQGITVEIGGDTTKLSKALEGVNKSIKGTQSGLKDVNKLLKLDPTNTELVVQKQKMLKDAIEATKEKLATLKTAAQQANEQLANGEITQQQYDALQREIAETEQNLKSLADMESWMPDFMQGLANGINANTSLVTAAAENLSTTLSTSITNSMRGVEQAYSQSWTAISQTVRTGTAGVSAAMKSAWSSITTSTSPHYKGVAAYADFDMILIACGTNDGVPSGNIEGSFTPENEMVAIEELDRKVFASAFRYSIEKLQQLYPAAKIYICTPIQGYITTRSYAQSKAKGDYLKLLAGRMSLIGHLNKKEGTKGLYRSLGSIDVVAAARSVLQVEK